MRVLVTGHLGYIGSSLVPMLERAGHQVTGLDSSLFSGTMGDGPSPVPTWTTDVRDVAESDLDGFDAVIHLAAISNDPLGDVNPDVTYDINHRASVRLAHRAKQAGVQRFLFASSASLYGKGGEGETLDESARFQPVTPYGRSKVLAEEGLHTLAGDGFSPTFLRCATAYGFTSRLRTDLVVNNLTGYAVTKGEVILKSDGQSWRPLIHVEDISRAYLALLEAPIDEVHDQAFNVGSTGDNFRIREVADLVQSVVPECRVRFAAGAGPDVRTYRLDCRKLEHRLPKYRAQWTVRAGVEQLYDKFVEYGLTYEEFDGPKFVRIKQVLQLQRVGLLDSSLRRVDATTLARDRRAE